MSDDHSSPVLQKKSALDNGLEIPSAPPNLDENDPCLKTSTRKSSHRKFHEIAEEKIRNKSGLSRRGIIIAGIVLLFLFILIIVVITLAACWPTTPHQRQFPVCEKAACLRVVSQIREGLNKSTSPCNDVVAWACGNWLQSHTIPLENNHWSRREEMYKREMVRAHELVSTLPQPLDHKSIKYKIKRFYDSCMNIENVEADGVQVLARRITDLDGWHVLREWNINDSDYRKVLEQLHAIYGVTPFFKITVVPHPHTPNANIIQIEPSGLGLPDKNFYYLESNHRIIQAYKRLIRDVVIIFQTSAAANSFGEDMFHFEKRLAEITPDTISLQDPVSLHNLISVSELKITAASLPLESILQSMFPQGKITDDTEILVVSMDYLTSVSVLISNTERSALNDYFMWTFTREYLPFLSSNVLAELHEYSAEVTGIKKPVERWELCLQFTRKFMGLGIESILEIDQHVTDQDAQIVEDIFENIRTAAKAVVADMDYPPELDKHIKYKLTSMRLQIGLPVNVLTEQYLMSYYEKLFIQKSNLFNSVLNGFEFLNIEKQRRYINPKPEDKLIPYLVQEKPKISYANAANVIVIPKLFLKESFYNSEYPRSVIYARLGFEMAKAVASSILPFGSMWRAENTLLTKYHLAYNESLFSIMEPMDCLLNRIIQENITNSVFNLTALNVFKHITAVNIAHRALEISLVNEEHTHQPTLENYEDSAIFFLSYVQGQCSKNLPEYDFLVNNDDFQLTDMQQLKLTWTQVDDFSKSLGCEINVNKQCF